MRVLLLGAGGFIGQATSPFLENRGHEVLAHDWSKSGDLQLQDLDLDYDVLVNAAGRLGAPGVEHDQLVASNTGIPRMIAEIWRSRGGGFHVVHLSTPGVCGLVAGAWEYLPLRPWGEYERTKADGELLLSSAIPSGRLRILRPDFVYGPGDRHKLALWRQISKGWIPLVGRGEAVIRPTFVEDVCRAIEAALPGGALSSGEVYNIAGPEKVAVRDFYHLIASSLGLEGLRTLRIPRLIFRLALHLGPLRPGALTESRFRLFGTSHYVLTGKAWQTGFRSSTPLDTGIRMTSEWYMEQGLV